MHTTIVSFASVVRVVRGLLRSFLCVGSEEVSFASVVRVVSDFLGSFSWVVLEDGFLLVSAAETSSKDTVCMTRVGIPFSGSRLSCLWCHGSFAESVGKLSLIISESLLLELGCLGSGVEEEKELDAEDTVESSSSIDS